MLPLNSNIWYFGIIWVTLEQNKENEIQAQHTPVENRIIFEAPKG